MNQDRVGANQRTLHRMKNEIAERLVAPDHKVNASALFYVQLAVTYLGKEERKTGIRYNNDVLKELVKNTVGRGALIYYSGVIKPMLRMELGEAKMSADADIIEQVLSYRYFDERTRQALGDVFDEIKHYSIHQLVLYQYRDDAHAMNGWTPNAPSSTHTRRKAKTKTKPKRKQNARRLRKAARST